jgi:hypothetical protein
LYFQGPGIREIEHQYRDNRKSTAIKEKSVYCKNSILYKFTHKDELIYTKSTDGSIDGNSGKYAAENQANEGGFQTPTDFKTIGKWKLFGRQFLSMDVMFEALFVLS